MRTAYKLFMLLIVLMVMAACGGEEAEPTATSAPEPTAAEAEPTKAPEPEPTEVEQQPTEPPATGLTCEEPIKIGLISDLTGALSIYGTMIEQSFMLGMEHATGAVGTDNVFKVDNCEIEVLVRDDQGSAETTATLARELIELLSVLVDFEPHRPA